MSKELLQQALDALENTWEWVAEELAINVRVHGDYPPRQPKIAALKREAEAHQAAMAGLRAALAQPVEPHECKTDAEKLAFGYGWWQSLEANRNAVAQPVEPVVDAWRTAVDQALMAAALDCTTPDTTPADALRELITWHVQIALDPSVSSDAQALIDRGRGAVAQPVEPAQAGGLECA